MVERRSCSQPGHETVIPEMFGPYGHEFLGVQRLRDRYFDNASYEWVMDCRGNTPSRYFGRTDAGLIVLEADSFPNIVLTPWGKLSFISSSVGLVVNTEGFWQGISKEVYTGKLPYLDFTHPHMQKWAIKEIDDLEIPKPQVSEQARRVNDPERDQEWTALLQKYNSLETT